jgi:hypothetical protein
LSTNIGSVVFAIQAIDEASGVMGKISASMGLMGMELQQLGPGFAQVGQVMQGFAVGGLTGAIVVGMGEVVQGIQQAVGAAAASQQAWAMLQNALHLTGAAWAAQQPQIQKFVQGLEQVTTVSQTAAVQGLQQLATFGMSATQAETALSAATNLSAAKNIDLSTAVTLVGKAFDGVTTTLTRYGIMIQTATLANAALKLGTADLTAALQKAGTAGLQPFTQILQQAGISLDTTAGKAQNTTTIVKELVTAWQAGTISTSQMNDITQALGINFDWTKAKASDYAQILAQINTMYGGAAQTQLDTYAGKTLQLANEWADLQVQIGDMLLPTLTNLASWLDLQLPKFSSWISSLALDPSVQTAWSKLLDVFHSFTASGDLTALMGFVAMVAKGAIDVTLDIAGTALSSIETIMKDIAQLQASGWLPGGTPPGQTGPGGITTPGVTPGITPGSTPGSSGAPNWWQPLLEQIAQTPWLAGIATQNPQGTLAPTPGQGFSNATTASLQGMPTGPAGAPASIAPPIQDAMNQVSAFVQKGAQDAENWFASIWPKATTDTIKGTGDVVSAASSGIGPLASTTLNIGKQVTTNLGSGLWSKVSTAVQGGLSTIGGALSNAGNVMTTTLGNAWTTISTGAQTGLDTVSAAVSTAGAGIQTGWTTAMAALEALNPWGVIQGAAAAGISGVTTALAGGGAAIASAWGSAMSQLEADASGAVASIEGFFANLGSTVASEVSNLSDTLIGHSLWTDMLEAMVSQTQDNLGKVTDSFKQTAAAIPPLIPTIVGSNLPSPAAPAPQTGSSQLPLQNQTVVQLNGQTIASIFEQKMIRQRKLASAYKYTGVG